MHSLRVLYTEMPLFRHLSHFVVLGTIFVLWKVL